MYALLILAELFNPELGLSVLARLYAQRVSSVVTTTNEVQLRLVDAHLVLSEAILTRCELKDRLAEFIARLFELASGVAPYVVSLSFTEAR